MAHRGDKKGKGDRGDRGSKHTHNWVLTRTVHNPKHIYRFYECVNPGCPQGDKMEVEDK